MPGRKYTAGTSYRYGFNGKENDNEVKGEGNQQDYGFRINDPRLGRFLSVDPLSPKYPFYTPYQFASNTPILAKDLDGLESDKNLNYTEQSEVSQNLKGGALTFRQDAIGNDGLTKFTKGALNTLLQAFGALTEIPAQMHYGDRIRPENQAGTFPLTNGQDFRHWLTAPLTAPLYAIDNIRNDPTNPEIWGANLVILVPYAKPFVKVGNSVIPFEKVSENVAAVHVYAKGVEILNSTPKSAMPRAISAAYDKTTGQVYYGMSGVLNENSVLNPLLTELMPSINREKWPVMNCAECDALNNALNGGAKPENLQIHTIKINKGNGTVEDFNTCANCAVTTKGMEVTSDKKNP